MIDLNEVNWRTMSVECGMKKLEVVDTFQVAWLLVQHVEYYSSRLKRSMEMPVGALVGLFDWA